MKKELHVVSFDYPYPPVYGGVIDVYYKLKALHAQGISIHLHYFAEKEIHNKVLSSLCSTVHFYPKSSFFTKHIFHSIPLRMLFRISDKLIQNLSATKNPVLYEGLHTSFSALHVKNTGQKVFLRCHNVEADYAAQLGNIEDNMIKKLAFKVEAHRTRKFEKSLSQFDALFSITSKDARHFKAIHKNVICLPVFHAHERVQIKKGIGKYILFHGNLSVKENLDTAEWISNTLAIQDKSSQYMIAGKSNEDGLKDKLKKSNVRCVLNPDQEQMKQLIQEAQIVLLKTAVPAGIKLKLIDSLAYARHIITDSNTVQNSSLQDLVHQFSTTQDVLDLIHSLKLKELSNQECLKRESIFNERLNNAKNAQILINEIF